MNQSLYVSHYCAVISMKYDSGRKLREQQRTERHSRRTSLQSPATPSKRQHHGCVHSGMLGELEGHFCFWAEDEKRPSWTEFVMKEKLGYLCRERENLRDISASLFFKLPSCFWNPGAPFTPWLYLYHKNTISGSGVGARQ